MRASSLDGFLKRPNPAVRAILICGYDPTEVSDAGREALKGLARRGAGDVDVVQLDERSIVADPGRLADEVQAYSLLGGRRIIHVREADQAFGKAMAPLLKSPSSGNVVLAEAGGLRKSAPLRVLFEETDSALCVALNDGTDENAFALIDKILRQSNLTIGDEAKFHLLELSGRSSAILRQEVEKFALYCAGKGTAGVGDVDEVCGGDGGPAVDDVVLASFGGVVNDADLGCGELYRSGEDAGRIAAVAHQHAIRLIDLRREVDRGISPEQAVKSARPPIFFKLQARLSDELRFWPLEALLGVAAALSDAVRDSRSTPALAPAIVNRALLAVARKARMLRSERF